MLLSVGMPSLATSIAYFSYQNYMIKARLTDAQAVLIKAALFMERFYTENNYYDQDTGGTAVARPAPINESPWDVGAKDYDIVVQASSASTFTLRATSKNVQAADGFLEITNTFAKAWDADNVGSVGAGESTWTSY